MQDLVTRTEFKEGVKGLELKIDTLDFRVGSLESKVEVLDSKVQSLDSKVEALDSKVQSLDSKVEALDSKVQALDSKVQALDSKVDTMESRLESRIQEGVEEIRRHTLVLFEDVQSQIRVFADGLAVIDRKLDITYKVLNREDQALSSRMDRIERTFYNKH